MKVGNIVRLVGVGPILLAPAAGFAQQLGQGQENGVSVLRIVLALSICLALAVGAAFALKAHMGRTSMRWPIKGVNRRLELVESVRLPHQIDLSIVRIGEDEIMVATSAQGLVVVRDRVTRQPPMEEPGA